MKYNKEQIGNIIKNERKNRGLSQNELGELIFVSGKQVSQYEKGALFPPLSVLCDICDVFECELGYLLGEESYTNRSRLRTEISRITSLCNESIDMLHLITSSSKKAPRMGHESEQIKRILNSIFMSESLFNLIDCFSDLDDIYLQRNSLISEYNLIDPNVRNEAEALYAGTYEYKNDPDFAPSNDLYQALMLLDKLKDNMHDFHYREKIARYELNEAFENLVSSIYPKTIY